VMGVSPTHGEADTVEELHSKLLVPGSDGGDRDAERRDSHRSAGAEVQNSRLLSARQSLTGRGTSPRPSFTGTIGAVDVENLAEGDDTFVATSSLGSLPTRTERSGSVFSETSLGLDNSTSSQEQTTGMGHVGSMLTQGPSSLPAKRRMSLMSSCSGMSSMTASSGASIVRKNLIGSSSSILGGIEARLESRLDMWSRKINERLNVLELGGSQHGVPGAPSPPTGSAVKWAKPLPKGPAEDSKSSPSRPSPKDDPAVFPISESVLGGDLLGIEDSLPGGISQDERTTSLQRDERRSPTPEFSRESTEFSSEKYSTSEGAQKASRLSAESVF